MSFITGYASGEEPRLGRIEGAAFASGAFSPPGTGSLMLSPRHRVKNAGRKL
jgi:hypothetical protein